MIVARFWLARLTRRSIALTDGRWSSVLARESSRLGVERSVRLFESDRVSTPLTAGIANPFIVLPAGSSEWNDEHRQIVLRHELSHIARGDAFICVLSGIACAIYWFNPLVWVAARKLRSEQEHACDDRVITLGTPAAVYATHLLEVARSARSIGMSSFVSVAMARPSQLEGRLLAVLNHRRRSALTRARGAAAILIACLTFAAIAAIRPTRAESAIVVASQATPVVVTAEPAIAKITKPSASHEADSTVTGDVKVESGGTLVLDLKTGAGVTIRGANDDRVRVIGRLGGPDWRNTSFTMNTDGRDAYIRMDYLRRGGSQSSSHALEISVPRRFNVRIQSAGGEISIHDVEGTFTGGTGGGEILIDHARGNARLSTGGGEVTVQDSHLSGSVTTGGGEVLIQNVTGGLNASSGTDNVLYGGSNAREMGSALGRGVGSGVGGGVGSGVSGSVGGGVTFSGKSADGVRRASDGKLYVSKSGGAVSIAEAPNGAAVRTGGGSISIGATNGSVYASTGAGDVTVGAADGAVELSTGAGDVRVNVTSDGNPMLITSGSGKVTLILPRDFSGVLDLESAYTRNHRATHIDSDWPVSITETEVWDTREGSPRRYVRAQQSIGGGGPRVRVKTVNGNIVIKRR